MADRLMKKAGIRYDFNERPELHQLVRLVAQACAEMGDRDAILRTFGTPDPIEPTGAAAASSSPST
jgi:hypothetical protein